MRKVFILLTFLSHFVSGQIFYHEQAYNFVNKGTGSINKILPFENGTSLAVGSFEGTPFAVTLFEDGQISQFKPFIFLKGEITFTDIIKTSTNEYVIGGICNSCNQIKESSKGFILKLSSDLNTYSELKFLSSAVDTNVYAPILLKEKEGAIYATYSGSLNGFGTRSHISKHKLSDLSLIWKNQYNESFFSAPIMIDSKSNEIVVVASGYDANVVIKVDSEGSLLSLKKYPQGNSSSCMMSNEDIVLSVAKPYEQSIYLIEKNTNLKDSFTLNTGSIFLTKGIINNYESNRILLTAPFLSTSELPYYRTRDNIIILEVTDRITPIVSFPVPENGTDNRNYIGSLKYEEGKFYLVGNRKDGLNRPFYMVASTSAISPKAPTTFYNPDVCSDPDLVGRRVQKTHPAVLPRITNDVHYANKINFKGNAEDLWLDIYRPYDHYAIGSKDKRPAFVYVPGGGYAFTSENVHSILMQAAERGMIGIGVKYRVGIHPNFNNNPDSLAFFAPFYLKATYRAQQDLRDAIEFIYNHAEEYNIDKDKIFLAGFSAGGNMVLNYAHVTQEDFEQGIILELGNLKSARKVKGIIPIAAPFNVLNFQSLDPSLYIDVSEDTPMYFIHGTCDPLAFYTFGSQADPNSTRSIGAYNIVCQRQKLKLPYKLHSIIGGEHDLSTAEDEVYESMFKWIKEEVICGQPVNACITSTYSTTAPCSQVSTCPSCMEVNAVNYEEEKIYILPSVGSGLFSLSKPSNYKVTIWDMMGKPIDDMEGYIDALNLTHLPSGSYIVSIKNDYKTYNCRITKL